MRMMGYLLELHPLFLGTSRFGTELEAVKLPYQNHLHNAIGTTRDTPGNNFFQADMASKFGSFFGSTVRGMRERCFWIMGEVHQESLHHSSGLYSKLLST